MADNCWVCTVEMHAQFWSEVVKIDQLFDVRDGSALPRADAPMDSLELVGRALCKSILDDHPIGGGLSGWVLDFLVDPERALRAFRAAEDALRVLASFDSDLAARFRKALAQPDGLTLHDFDDMLPDEDATLELRVRTAKYFKSLPHMQEMLGLPVGAKLPGAEEAANGSAEPSAKRQKA